MSQLDAYCERMPPSPAAHGLLDWDGCGWVGPGRRAALPVHAKDPLNTVHKTIVWHVFPGTEGRHMAAP